MKNFVLNISKENENHVVRRTWEPPMPSFPGLHIQNFGGIRYRFSFSNGYGASVIKRFGSYGYEEDLWEIALLDKGGNLIYEYDFDIDVIGYQSDQDIDELLTKISKYGEEDKDEH